MAIHSMIVLQGAMGCRKSVPVAVRLSVSLNAWLKVNLPKLKCSCTAQMNTVPLMLSSSVNETQTWQIVESLWVIMIFKLKIKDRMASSLKEYKED